jgi:hypothetical protein
MTSTLQVGGPGWIERHLQAYLATDGAEGHLLDFRPGGGASSASRATRRQTATAASIPSAIKSCLRIIVPSPAETIGAGAARGKTRRSCGASVRDGAGRALC